MIPHLQGKVNINVKEKSNGDYVYSFNAEKESSTRRTLHAAVNTRKGANGELFLRGHYNTTQADCQEAGVAWLSEKE